MYKVIIDGITAHNPAMNDPDVLLSNGIVKHSANCADSFSFTVYPDNPAFSSIQKLTSTIEVYQDDECIFRGRPIQSRQGWNREMVYTCEGMLAYFNDSILRPYHYAGTLRGYIEMLVSQHNSQVEAAKQFVLRTVTVTAANDHVVRSNSDYICTMQELVTKLPGSKLGGYLVVEYLNGVMYLDYLANGVGASGQVITLSQNLLDFVREQNAESIATAIIPLGKADETTGERMTIKSVNGGLDYIVDNAAASRYGLIYRTETWDDVTNPTTLLANAQAMLGDLSIMIPTITLTAVDLSLVNQNIDPIRCLDYVTVLDEKHEASGQYLVCERSYNLSKPENDQVTFGSKQTSISAQTAAAEIAVQTVGERIESSVSAIAKAILEAGTSGTIYFRYDNDGKAYELDILDTDDPSTAQKIWRWNINGWGYSDDGGQTYRMAATMDGAISADFIKTGTLDANVIGANSITLGKLTSSAKDAIVSSSSVKTQYYLSTSDSSATGGSWQDTVPTWSSGKYVWMRVATTVTTINGTPSTSYSTGVYDKNLTDALSTAASAASTASSAQTTANGAVASASVKTQYYLSTSSSSATGGSWSDTIPTWASGKYIWTRVATTTTNGSGTSSTSYAPSSSGAYDKNLTNALSTAATASSTASTAQSTAAVALERGVEYIIGTQAASTNAWTGVTTDSAIYAGKTIAYYLPYAGTSSAATLNLTLSGGGTTGAKNVRINNTNVTTNYPAGTIIRLTYDGTYWKSDNYDSNNYDRTRYNSNILAVSAITAAHLIVGTSAGYKHLAASVAFDLSYPILYAGSAIAANANGTNNYTMMSGVNFSTTGTIQSGASKKVLYLKGTVSGTTFTVAASNWLTTVVPTAASTDFYIPLGVMSSSTSGSFLSSSQLWAYVNGFFQQVQAITKDASLQEQTIYISKASGTSSVSATTTWITDTNGNQNVWTLKRPVYSTSYPVLFVAVQRKTVGGTITCTTPVKDDTTTVIDGGHIITGSIDASKITVTDLSALNATIAEWTINQAYIGKSAAFDFSEVSIFEAAYIRNYLLGYSTLEEAIARGADIDGDGDVTLLDLALVRNLVLGFIPATGTAKVSMRSDNPFSALSVDVGGVTLFEAGIHGCFAPNIYASRIAGIEQNSANSFPGPLAIEGSTVSIKGDDWGSVPKIANATNSIYSLTGSKKLCIQFVTKTVTMKVDQAWGTWYESAAQVDFGNWPTAFSARPYVAYKIFNSDTASASQVMGQGTKAPTTTQVGSAYIYRPTANANNTTYTGMAVGIGYIA